MYTLFNNNFITTYFLIFGKQSRRLKDLSISKLISNIIIESFHR